MHREVPSKLINIHESVNNTHTNEASVLGTSSCFLKPQFKNALLAYKWRFKSCDECFCDECVFLNIVKHFDDLPSVS